MLSQRFLNSWFFFFLFSWDSLLVHWSIPLCHLICCWFLLLYFLIKYCILQLHLLIWFLIFVKLLLYLFILLSLLSIFTIITLNSLSNSLYIFTLVSSSGVLSCSFTWNLFLCLLILPDCFYFYILGRLVRFPVLGKCPCVEDIWTISSLFSGYYSYMSRGALYVNPSVEVGPRTVGMPVGRAGFWPCWLTVLWWARLYSGIFACGGSQCPRAAADPLLGRARVFGGSQLLNLESPRTGASLLG